MHIKTDSSMRVSHQRTLEGTATARDPASYKLTTLALLFQTLIVTHTCRLPDFRDHAESYLRGRGKEGAGHLLGLGVHRLYQWFKEALRSPLSVQITLPAKLMTTFNNRCVCLYDHNIAYLTTLACVRARRSRYFHVYKLKLLNSAFSRLNLDTRSTCTSVFSLPAAPTSHAISHKRTGSAQISC